MLAVPESINKLDLAFGNISHMPNFRSLPEEFQRERHPCCRAVEKWFFSGAARAANGITVDGVTYSAKEGVDHGRALAAIKAVLNSFETKHEHKIAACGYMLSEWFDASRVHDGGAGR